MYSSEGDMKILFLTEGKIDDNSIPNSGNCMAEVKPDVSDLLQPSQGTWRFQGSSNLSVFSSYLI